MDKIRKKKLWLDAAILLITFLLILALWYLKMSSSMIMVCLSVVLIIGALVVVDIIRIILGSDQRQHGPLQEAATISPHQLILLNEEEKPIRAWDLTGKTAMIIGRIHRDMDVDVDLSACEYSALINVQHAVMNYCLDSWYLEDLGSQNGIQIKKVEDGKCYQVAASRPCKVSAGDVIYIAKTRLLFT